MTKIQISTYGDEDRGEAERAVNILNEMQEDSDTKAFLNDTKLTDDNGIIWFGASYDQDKSIWIRVIRMTLLVSPVCDPKSLQMDYKLN